MAEHHRGRPGHRRDAGDAPGSRRPDRLAGAAIGKLEHPPDRHDEETTSSSHWISGTSRPGDGPDQEVVDPSTSEVQWTYAAASPALVEKALDAAAVGVVGSVAAGRGAR